MSFFYFGVGGLSDLLRHISIIEFTLGVKRYDYSINLGYCSVIFM